MTFSAIGFNIALAAACWLLTADIYALIVWMIR